MNNYIINVSRAGFHYCRIEIPETTEEAAIAKATEIRNLFSKEFRIDMTCWNNIGQRVEF